MLILGLGTSYGVKTRIDIANNSSNNIKLKITINELIRLYNEDGNNLWEYDKDTNSWEYSEELIINRNQTVQLKILSSLNSWPEPSELVDSVVFYNENNEIIKEFNSENNSEEMSSFLLNYRKRGSRNNRIFTLFVTDKLLE
jgi:hypothetical protein